MAIPGRVAAHVRIRQQGAELAAHPLRPTHFEEIPHVRLFAVAEGRFVAERHVAPHEARLLDGRDERQAVPEHETRMRPGRLAVRMHDNGDHQPEPGYAQHRAEVGRTSRLLRAVTELRPSLTPRGPICGIMIPVVRPILLDLTL